MVMMMMMMMIENKNTPACYVVPSFGAVQFVPDSPFARPFLFCRRTYIWVAFNLFIPSQRYVYFV